MRLYNPHSFVCVLYDQGGCDVSACGRLQAWVPGAWLAGQAGCVQARNGPFAPPPHPYACGGFPQFFPTFSRRSFMTVDDILHDFVLQLLKRGFTTQQVAEALASQKIKLMQADEYMDAQKQGGSNGV